MIYKKLERALQSSKTEEEWIKKLQKIKDINYIDEEGFCALGISAYFGSLQACKYILDRGANPDLKNKYGETPLCIAIENWASKGHHFFNAEAIISLLLERGADVNAYDNDKKTILMHASKKLNALWIEHEKIIQKLINKGADIHAIDMYGINVLMYAANAGNYYIIQKLIDRGVNIHLKDEDGKNALYYAAEYSWNSGYADDLEKQKKSKEKIIALLLSKNIDLNTYNKSTGDTLLHITSYYGESKLVNLCVNNKANINAQDNSGKTALINTAITGHADIANTLLIAGADPTIKDKDKKTAIWYAWKWKNANVEKIFIKHKIPLHSEPEVNDIDKYGRTILMHACMRNSEYNYSTQKVIDLLKEKIDVNIQDKYGKTALIHLLDNYYYGDEDRKKFDLLMHVADISVNIQAKNGMTALMYVCKVSLVDHYYIHQLLQKGADVNIKDKKGKTAISYVKSYDTELKKTLLKHLHETS